MSQSVIELTFMPWWIHWQQTGRELLAMATKNFNDANPGLRLTAIPGPQGGGVGTAGVITSILSGTGPDVIGDCCTSWVSYLSQNLFADLTPYLKQDNIPLSTWATAQTQALNYLGKQYGLPIYNGPVVFLYRQDILDTLGLSYPDTNWDWKAAADLWTRCAGTVRNGSTTTHRYGANIWWSANGWNAQAYLMYGFGGALMDPTHTQCLLGDQHCIDAGNWVYPLLWNKVAGASTGSALQGTAVFEAFGEWNIPHQIVQLAQSGVKWQFHPVPRYPNGRTTFNNNDFWGMNAASKHLDQAWLVLKWVAQEDFWQRFCMNSTLLAPSKVSLWPEFEARLQAVAPPLKNRGLQWYRDAVQGGYGYPEEFFAYQPQQAISVLGQAMGQIYDQKESVSKGFATAATQIDQQQAVAKAAAQRSQATTAQFPTNGPKVAGVPTGI